MFKILSGLLLRYKIFNPIYRLILMNTCVIPNLNMIQRSTPLIVSISSDEDNFFNLEYMLYSIFKQKVLPDKVVLWLSDEYELSELPYSITKFVKNGLEIRFVKDKGSYTKIIYALKEYKDCIIVTADDSVYYPKNWLARLYHSYITNPKDIQVHCAATVTDKEDKLLAFNEWKFFKCEEIASFKYFPLGEGGVLYPPNCFIKEVFREDIYDRKVGVSWDIWSWVMSVVSDRKIRPVKNHINRYATINLIRSFKNISRFVNRAERTDIQLQHLFEYYGNNITKKLSKK